MAACNYQHVPNRLHTDDKPVIPSFEVGEQVYRRCTKEELDNPFLSTKLYELSVNRQGLSDNRISDPGDVLFNITASEPERHSKEICVMVIRDLNENTGTYDKSFQEEKNGQVRTATIKLVHDPDPCMYPHCVFRIHLDDILVTEENYRNTLKKVDKIRDYLRTALGAMVLQKQISQQLT